MHDVTEILHSFGVDSATSIQRGGGTATPNYAVETAQGRFVVRSRPSDFTNIAFVQFDHEILQRLHQKGLPVPLPKQRPDGSTWAEVDGQMFEMLSWVEGNVFAWEDQESLSQLGLFLARFHRAFSSDIPSGKNGWLREDHASRMEKDWRSLTRMAPSERELEELVLVAKQLALIRDELDSGLYDSLPHCVIHGDVHPGNIRFRDSRVVALYDFDYLSWQARTRDIVDGIIFFCARRESAFHPHEIRSLTQPFLPDKDRTLLLLRAYASVSPFTDDEWRAIPLLMRSRWIQMRLRGCRKISDGEKISFILDRIWEPIRWLDDHAETTFALVRAQLEPS